MITLRQLAIGVATLLAVGSLGWTLAPSASPGGAGPWKEPAIPCASDAGRDPRPRSRRRR